MIVDSDSEPGDVTMDDVHPRNGLTSSEGKRDPKSDRWSTTDGLHPVMVYQLVGARRPHRDAKFSINGREVHKITTVASVVDTRTDREMGRSRWTDFFLEDGSKFGGRIFARVESAERIDIGLHEYVRVAGRLTAFKQLNWIEADYIRKINHPNEVEFHLLEAMLVTMACRRGPPPLRSQISACSRASTSGVTGPSKVTEGESRDISSNELVNYVASTHTETAARGSSERDRYDEYSKGIASGNESEEEMQAQYSKLEMWASSGIAESRNENLASPSREAVAGSAPGVGSTEPWTNAEASTSRVEMSSPETGHRQKRKALPSRRRSSYRAPDPYSGLSLLQRKIILEIRSAGPPASPYASILYEGDSRPDWIGADLHVISEAVRVSCGAMESEIRLAIDDLIRDAFIYKTIDDWHVNVT